MAKKISIKKLSEVKERVLHGGDCLERVAFEWRLPLEVLKEQLEATYDGGRKNSQYKAIIQTSERNASRVPEEELERMRILPKPKRQAKASKPAPVSAAQADPMEELLRKRDELQKQLVARASSLEEAEAILGIRQGALSDVKAVLKKVQCAVQQAEAEEAEAKTAVQQAQTRKAETQAALQKLEEEIQRSQVYLVAPWFSGELPTFGTFLSTVRMEEFQVIKPAEPIEPDFKDMVSAGFDQVSEYVSALCFVSLVQEYILKGEAHSVLNTDPRVQKLLDKHIG